MSSVFAIPSSVTLAPSPQVADVPPENSGEKLAFWLRSDETPLLYKTCAIALLIILSYAAGALIGYPLLGAALFFLYGVKTVSDGWQTLSEKRAKSCRRSDAHHGVISRAISPPNC